MVALCHLLACSRPPVAESFRADEVLKLGELCNSVDDSRRTYLEAMFLHLEVRWQQFSDMLSKFRDLDAMLAICTDDVTWVQTNGVVMRGTRPELSKELQYLITQRLSIQVCIESTSVVTEQGSLDLTLDRDGNCGRLEGDELLKATSCLNILLGNRRKQLADAGTEGKEAVMLLEKDKYELLDEQGKIVEQGDRVILWKHHNNAWCICGHMRLS